MRLCIIVPDGMADWPAEFPGGMTPLAAAATPNMDRLAREGETGTAVLVPEGHPVGSDSANLAVLGIEPGRYEIGRGAIEAAGLGVELGPNDVALRMNLVTLRDDPELGEVMEDYSGSGVTTEQARRVVEAVRGQISEVVVSDELRAAGVAGIDAFPGVDYRHLVRFTFADAAARDAFAGETRFTPPHDIQGRPVAGFLPEGAGAALARRAMNPASEAVARAGPAVGSRANSAWLWAPGRRVELPSLKERFGLSGAAIAGVDLVRGVARLLGMEVIAVEGATGNERTNFAGKGEAAAEALARFGLVFVHVEAPDEAGHHGDPEAKRRAIESVDAGVVGPVLARAEALDAAGEDVRVLVLPDHLTPCSTRTHAHGAVPFALFGTGVEPNGAERLTEAAAEATGVAVREGWRLIERALEPARPGARFRFRRERG